MKKLYWILIIIVIAIGASVATYFITKPKAQTEDEEVDETVRLLNGVARRF